MGATTKAATTTAKSFLTASFSGSGHLLPYHLGVSSVLLEHSNKTSSSSSSLDKNFLPPIRAVAGSSSGAIAATVLALLPHRLDEYTDRFLTDRGHAFRNLKSMLLEEEKQRQGPTSVSKGGPDDLVVCTTRCSDGSMQLFKFSTHELLQRKDGIGRSSNSGGLLKAVEASCRIPTSFHPVDIFLKCSLQYYDGIEIDGELFADGGISAPVPPLTMQVNDNIDKSDDAGGGKQEARLVVSPISGSFLQQEKNVLCYEIRPQDTSWAVPYHLTCRCGSFRIRMSIQNLRALVASAGAVSPQDLRAWHQHGVEDAKLFIDAYFRPHT